MDATNGPSTDDESTPMPPDVPNVQHAFHHVYTMLKMFGMYSDMIAKYSKKDAIKVSAKNVAQFVYCVILELLLIVNASEYVYELYSFSNGDGSLSLTFSVAGVLTNTALVVYLPLSLWKLSSRLEELLNDLQLFINRNKTQINMLRCRKIVLIIFVAYIFVGVLNTFVVVLLTKQGGSQNNTASLAERFRPDEVFELAGVPQRVVLVWGMLMTLLYGGASLVLVVLFVLVTYIIIKCMRGFSQGMNANLTNGISDRSVRRYRGEFETLSDIVERYDSCVNYQIGTIYLFGWIIPCIALYGFVHDHLSDSDLSYFLSYMMTAGIFSVVYILIAIFLNSAMHKPLASLYRMNTEGLTEKGLHELSMFMSRLSGSPIGVSVYGLFVIDTSTVLMWIGTLVTYAVIVLQFQPIQSTCHTQTT